MRIIIIVFLVVFVVLQFFRPAKPPQGGSDKSITAYYAIPPAVQTILVNACYDCHSNHTNYPWYTNIQPVGWLTYAHIRDGKTELNFDEFGAYSAKRQRNKLSSMREQVQSGKMPLASYTWLHPAARLTRDEKSQLLRWLETAH
ncbi:Haem-binding domain-containing protein [Chitinophaga jiangningensis]|uniref:Haem-binding domain-containing protein n=1 Tax=Chitinophaga jiangningensis TaxID=1419482 RepID=A0A1M7KJA8_9BACT|nr:heme-binding domain-containing protein [Chitinophaga jiangningensis]SHM65485.1 Haem-binding domain-containing protein [Chitinophaga jiangningensis]